MSKRKYTRSKREEIPIINVSSPNECKQNVLLYTIQDCEKWKQNPLVNPKTGRSIKKNSATYLKIKSQCELLETPITTFSQPKLINNWCQLTQEQKQPYLENISSLISSSRYPIEIQRHDQSIKWDPSSDNYHCYECDDKNSDDFQKAVDMYCYLTKYSTNITKNSIHPRTPAVQYETKQDDAIPISPSDNFLEEYNPLPLLLETNNRLNITSKIDYYIEEKKIEYQVDWDKVSNEQKRMFWGDLIKRTDLPGEYVKPSPDKYYIVTSKWNKSCSEIIYFKQASLYLLLIYGWPGKQVNKITNILFKPDITLNEWKECIKSLQDQFMTTVTKNGQDMELNPIKKEYTQFMTENLQLIRKEILNIKCSIYKIHLQPKSQYLLWVLYNLILLLNNSDDFYTFKIIITYENSQYQTAEKQYDNIPIIVIYCKAGEVSFNNLIQLILTYFKGVDYKQIGLDIMPRFNIKINELIYYAQADGDWKKILMQYGVLSDYFDKDNNYGKMKDSLKL